MSLVEKGWAKLHGTYARIESGLSCFAAIHLTGVPSERIAHKDAFKNTKDFWNKLKLIIKRNYIMMTSFQGAGDEK